LSIGDPSVPNDLRKSSSILQGELAFMRRLQEWLGEKCTWNLCYRASKDGWSAEDFHKHCDNKGPTVILVKANNYIFGGYTDQNWQGLSMFFQNVICLSRCQKIIDSHLKITL
jgi:hypothetical protein